MRFETLIALRYLKDTRKTRFLSFITLISILGIAIGTSALIVVQSVMDGLQGHMKSTILGASAHIRIENKNGEILNYRILEKKIKQIPQIKGVTPLISADVMFSAGSDMTGVALKGIDLNSLNSVFALSNWITKGSLAMLDNSLECKKLSKYKKGTLDDDFSKAFAKKNKNISSCVLIGSELAKYYGLTIGDIVTIVSPAGGGIGPTGPLPLSKKFKISGIFHSGLYDYDMSSIYISLNAASKFMSKKKSVDTLNIKLKDMNETTDVVALISKKIGKNFRIRTWKQINKNIFGALKMEKLVWILIMSFVVLVAAFNIISMLIMMVLGKKQDIAVLKSIGVSNKSIMRIFITDGMIVGIFGTFLGMLGAFFVCKLLASINLNFASDVYYMTHLPVKISFLVFVLVGLGSLLITFIATIYPAQKAASVKPAEGLRYDGF